MKTKTRPPLRKKGEKQKKSRDEKEQFDAIKTMREIRDQLSREIMNMTFEEEKAYLKNLLAQKDKQ